MTTPNDFESELAVAAEKSLAATIAQMVLPGPGSTYELGFTSGARCGYERGKAERDALSALCDMLAPQKVTDGIINMQKELTEARAEIERLKNLMALEIDEGTKYARNQVVELRALAARMAEALKGVILEIKKEYGDSLKYLVSNVARNAYLDAGKALAEYEAFERENKG